MLRFAGAQIKATLEELGVEESLLPACVASVPADKVISSGELIEWRDGLSGEPLAEVLACLEDTVTVAPAVIEKSRATAKPADETAAEPEPEPPAPMLADAAEDLGGSTMSLDDRMGISTVPKA